MKSVDELLSAVTSLVESVESVVADAGKAGKGRTKRAAPSSAAMSARSAKLKKALKSHWASMTPAQRAARVRKMLAGRGLKPKPKGRSKASGKK